MVNIQWRDRSTNALGFDRPVFPDDVTFKRVKTGDGKDRVYELKYKASGAGPNAQRWFFWMQEPKPEVDEANAKAFLDAIDHPPAEGAEAGAGGAGGSPEDVAHRIQRMNLVCARFEMIFFAE